MALITSESGAALQDFLRILQRRNYAGHIYLLPASVQGQQALPEICQRLEQARTLPDIDLVVLTRGGGSAEDLQVFNQEKLARLLADYPVPTLSAIGHEIDTVLTDYVADQRAETPSAAAEMISSQWLRRKESLQQNILKFQQTFTQSYLTKRAAFIRLSQQLDPRLAIRHCELKALKLDSAENRLLHNALGHQQTKLNRLKSFTQRLQRFHPAIEPTRGQRATGGFLIKLASMPAGHRTTAAKTPAFAGSLYATKISPTAQRTPASPGPTEKTGKQQYSSQPMNASTSIFTAGYAIVRTPKERQVETGTRGQRATGGFLINSICGQWQRIQWARNGRCKRRSISRASLRLLGAGYERE